MDRFGHIIAVETFGAAFAAKAGFLDPAKGRVRHGNHKAVEANHAGIQRIGDKVRLPRVFGEGIGRKAKG